jgi:sugar lactone lactonase YvrE
MLKKRMLLLAALTLALPLAAHAQEATPEATSAMMVPGLDQIMINRENFFPEGIEYDAQNGRFLVGSTADGGVYTVADNGDLTQLIQDEHLTATVGLHIDASRGRLLVASNGKPEGLGIYNLNDGSPIAYVDLASLTPDAQHFINDVAVDKDGNAYVTDSYAGVIYRVTPDGKADIFLDDPSFKQQFALNGIDYDPAGYLVAVRAPDLIRIPLDDPKSFAKIDSEADFSNADGLYFAKDGLLIVVANQRGKVYAVTSDDQFKTASVMGEFDAGTNFPTTATARGGEVYVLYAHLDKQQAGQKDFTIQKVTFEAPQR